MLLEMVPPQELLLLRISGPALAWSNPPTNLGVRPEPQRLSCGATSQGLGSGLLHTRDRAIHLLARELGYSARRSSAEGVPEPSRPHIEQFGEFVLELDTT